MSDAPRRVVVQQWLDGSISIHTNEDERIRYIEQAAWMFGHATTKRYIGIVDEGTWDTIQNKGTLFVITAPPKEER